MTLAENMTQRLVERHERAPSALRFMARAFRRSPDLTAGTNVPRLAAQWSRLRVEPAQLAAFGVATGLPVNDGVPVLYPQVVGFRLQMALLTHPLYPLPIWTALQIRNRLVRHARIEPGETLDLRTQVDGQRVVNKGLEVDLVSRLMRGPQCCWEGRTTFLHRGRFGSPDPVDMRAESPDLSDASQIARWRVPEGGGWAFGKLTGDFNGIHCWDWYARRFGFSGAFAHPQRVAAACMARLQNLDAEAQTLDLWFKGPVFYGADVMLSAAPGDGELRFGLALQGDTRHALLGHWQGVAKAL